MNWLISALLALPLSGAGLLCGLLVADRCIRWYRISSFEGGSGYFAAMIAIAGAIIGFVVALVVAGVLAPQNGAGHWRSFGTALGAIAGLTLVVLALCRLGADLPPTLDGRQLSLELELRLPAGSPPPAKAGELELVLYRESPARRLKSRYAKLETAKARQEDGCWILPATVELFSRRGQRILSARWKDRRSEDFLLPLPARPGKAQMAWSDWLSNASAGPGLSYRYRVQPIIPPPKPDYAAAAAEREAREAEEFQTALAAESIPQLLERVRYYGDSDERRAVLQAVRERPDFRREILGLMQSDRSETVADALRFAATLSPDDPDIKAAVAAAGAELAERIKRFNTTPPELDPGFQRAYDASVRFHGWMEAARALRRSDSDDFVAELSTILELSRARTDSHAMQADVRRVASYYLEQWAGIAPLPDDPKPR